MVQTSRARTEALWKGMTDAANGYRCYPFGRQQEWCLRMPVIFWGERCVGRARY